MPAKRPAVKSARVTPEPRLLAPAGRKAAWAGRTFVLAAMLIGAFVFPGPMLYWEWKAGRELAPPDSVKSLTDFAAWRSDAKYYVHRNPNIVIARVSFHESQRGASGPAAYVFDSRARLVSWIDDDGEGFYDRWPVPSGNTVQPAEALRFLDLGVP
jgi:hypothetical protein